MFLFYLLVHDRTEWQDWTIGWIDWIERRDCTPSGPARRPGRFAAESSLTKSPQSTHILQKLSIYISDGDLTVIEDGRFQLLFPAARKNRSYQTQPA
jgi:hypothetical protein